MKSLEALQIEDQIEYNPLALKGHRTEYGPDKHFTLIIARQMGDLRQNRPFSGKRLELLAGPVDKYI